MDTKVSDISAQDQEALEWQARVELAAAHRIAAMQGLAEGIMNHLTMVVPGRTDRYYQAPFGLHWTEITASCFMEVAYADSSVLKGSGRVQRSAYCIHAPIHRDLPQAVCVMHTHSPFAAALTRLQDPRLKPIGQTEISIGRYVAYDHHFAGNVRDIAEGERISRALGDKGVLMMANHGVLTVGETVAQAYDRLYYIERAAQVQLYAMWTHQELKEAPAEVIEYTQRVSMVNVSDGSKPAYELHFDALRRMVDRIDTSYQK